MLTRSGESDRYLRQNVLKDNVDGVKLEESPFFEFRILLNATSNFDPMYKLGQGGFGPVYKVFLLFQISDS